MKKLDEAIAAAKGKAGAKRMIWARRAAQYEENINSGDPMKLAEVVRDLQRRSAADTMTFSARQLYKRKSTFSQDYFPSKIFAASTKC